MVVMRVLLGVSMVGSCDPVLSNITDDVGSIGGDLPRPCSANLIMV